MTRIGLLGGMSWESSAVYYRLVNEAVRERLGGLSSADCVLRSVDFARLEPLQREGRWDELGAILAEEGRALTAAGAGVVILCTNTMHRVADAIVAGLDAPLLHVADVTADAIHEAGLKRVGLLGTEYTMRPGAYIDRLQARHGLEVLTPGDSDRRTVHDIIFDELCRGEIHERSRRAYEGVIAGLAAQGAEGVIFGCTEIGLLLAADAAPLPAFDTTVLHAHAAVTFALSLPPAPAWAQRDGYVISTDRSRLDRETIWRFLREAYWSPGIERAKVERNLDHSLDFGLYAPDGTQAGFARLVTDTSGFAWLADVFVMPAHRGRGLGEWLVRTAVSHPETARLRILLATRDAHGLYERMGFRHVEAGRYMERRAPA